MQVNPAGDDHGGDDDKLKGGFVDVAGVVVVVKEDAAVEFGVLGAGTRGCDEGGISGEPPFGADFGPVVGFGADLLLEGCGRGVEAD